MRAVRMRRGAAVLATLLVTSVAAAACSSSSSSDDADKAPVGSGKVAVPSQFKGKLVAPAVVGYPPYAFLEGKDAQGISVDLAKALGGPWGETVTLKNDSFENALLGVNRETYLGAFGADVTAEREKIFDQVSFLKDYHSFMTLADADDIGDSMDSLCGLKIALVAADSSIPVLKEQSATCTKDGKDAITVLTFADQGAATLAVQSKQADATTATVTNLGYIQKKAGNVFKVSGPHYHYVLISVAAKKGNGMAQALADGINELIDSGEYAKILKRYGVESTAVERAEVNPDPNVEP
jgi:polar amino acid transport system substrate-binding protein